MVVCIKTDNKIQVLKYFRHSSRYKKNSLVGVLPAAQGLSSTHNKGRLMVWEDGQGQKISIPPEAKE